MKTLAKYGVAGAAAGVLLPGTMALWAGGAMAYGALRKVLDRLDQQRAEQQRTAEAEPRSIRLGKAAARGKDVAEVATSMAI